MPAPFPPARRRLIIYVAKPILNGLPGETFRLTQPEKYYSMKKPVRLEILGTADNPPPREGLPLYLSPIAAGFPSPAEDYLDRRLDLHEHL